MFKALEFAKLSKAKEILGELEAKNCFQIQSWAKYLIKTVIFISNRALRESHFVSFVVKGRFGQTSESLKTLLWSWLQLEICFSPSKIKQKVIKTSQIETRMCRFSFSYNPGYNILELFSVLVWVQFTTSKKKLDI